MAREWYFVRRLSDEEHPHSRKRLEVQVLDDDGLGVEVGYFDDKVKDLLVGAVRIPRAVLEAAKEKLPGQGDYVGADGRSLPPF